MHDTDPKPPPADPDPVPDEPRRPYPYPDDPSPDVINPLPEPLSLCESMRSWTFDCT